VFAALVTVGSEAGAEQSATQKPDFVAELELITGEPEFHMVPMRDGTKLWTAVWKPKGLHQALPTVLVRTPYTPDAEVSGLNELGPLLAKNGYALVIQNERGSFLSQGRFRLMGGAREDGYDAVDWVSRQPWSNGRIGTIGCSSSGDNQVPLAVTHHPAHVAMVTMCSGSSIGRMGPFREQGLVFRGGALQIGPWVPWFASQAGLRDQLKLPPDADEASIAYYGRVFRKRAVLSVPAKDYLTMERTLPIQDAVRAGGGGPTDFEYLWRMLPNDPRFDREPLVNEGEKINVPGLWVMEEYDVGIHPMLAAYEYAEQTGGDFAVRANQFAIIAPMTHCSFYQETEHTVVGEREIGDARFDYAKTFVAWFDHWVKEGARPGQQDFNRPRAEVYLPGRNRWQPYERWPAIARSVSYYLDSDGHANSRTGDGRLLKFPTVRTGTDTFVYDPNLPVPTTGGDSCCSPTPAGAIDQSEVEMRSDVLVYTSEPLPDGLDVVGWTEVDVFLSSDAPDTDLVAKLIDVGSDGRAFNIAESIQRVRWREGYQKAVFMKPGERYRVRVGPFFASNHFAAGHRIRIDITSSNFPRFDRNLNTGGNNFDESKGRVARNRVYHSAQFASRVVLPVVELH
jgi:hypothetical protein